jgi:Skp family chaperone for outer membrane proteins
MSEQLEKEVVNLQRQLQDLDNEARKVISKDQSDIAVQIFREIEQVINAVAATNNFDLVLSFPDSTTKDDFYSPDNVVRKLASQAAIPLYFKKHIDLTDAVITTLNASFPAPTTPPGAAPAAPAPGQPPQ